MANYFTLLEQANRLLASGAFLLVQDPQKGSINPMTIGWATFGIVWGKPVCAVFVRHSRYTHELMEGNERFTVAFPKDDSMKEALSFCGSKSGRDTDKLRELGINASCTDERIVLDGCGIHFNCKKLFKAEGNLEDMDREMFARFYAPHSAQDGDVHTIYFGEITSADNIE